MHGLPKNFDANFLNGKTLDLVCCAQYQVYLHLSGACLLGIEGELAVNDSGPLRLPDSLLPLFGLIGKTVEAASGDKLGTLTLSLEGGHKISIFDSSTQFESYSITNDGVTLAIV